MSALERIAQLRAQAQAEIAAAGDTGALEELRIRYLGRRAELPQLLRGVAALPPEQRAAVGGAANAARAELEALIEGSTAGLADRELDARLAADRVDVTLPGTPAFPPGHLHVITQTQRDIEDIFLGLGFNVAEGPEVELVAYNFDALNFTATHPARACSDTFHVSGEAVLRTHTSPVQVRAMMQSLPPLYV